MIYHLVETKLWNESDLSYKAQSLDIEGFIHFSTKEQVEATYKRFYLGLEMLLLEVDETLLTSKLIYEEADGSPYPHLYGPLNKAAIIKVSPYIYADT